MGEATGTVEPGHPWRGKPSFQIKYDPAAAKKLMSEAGYSAAKPLTVKVQISASGSGQMQPLPMNEFMQQNLKECFFDVEFDVIEWNTLLPTGASAPRTERARCQRDQRQLRLHGPVLRHGALRQHQGLPADLQQLGLLQQRRVDALIAKARTTFDPKA
jgi:ABC-type transport system substrate-binding protein